MLYALDHYPDGSPWQYTPFIHGTHDWAKQRLNAWRDGHGYPLAPRHVVLEEQAERLRAEQHQQRQEWAAALAQASATPLQAAQWARFLLSNASPRAARVIRARELAAKCSPAEDYRTDKERWDKADKAAQAAVESAAKWPAEPWCPPDPDDEQDPRIISLTRARDRAHRERRWRT
ncbi:MULTISPECIES: hypothetical protein [unclassified Streptosporangium]|uniref:hypothetical protein n=1 Tax=unclassified Streptosporangium TaxID=2632669 RepID=UPI002E27AA9E|nr:MULTISPECIES: hypothetical protein [unclassified Streptosporangium]